MSDTNWTTQSMTTARKKTKPAAPCESATTFWIQDEDLIRPNEFAAKHDLSAWNVINRALKRFLDDPNPIFCH